MVCFSRYGHCSYVLSLGYDVVDFVSFLGNPFAFFVRPPRLYNKFHIGDCEKSDDHTQDDLYDTTPLSELRNCGALDTATDPGVLSDEH